ncbi:tRNA-His guanylyltransferase [Pseudomonas phage 201phi2-1]|uniref:Putative Thg1 n=1 Tax=Pseudomonas phage 201phi2-1 TaxID=198110 RepID=B3FJH9_BP201|nr:tRNA-His guanylyltransferase [Pseudomonas phage 201phi2-1]ABY63144.1 putative Thg1 [Pseudomonas phage 201phi2-1]
MKDQLGDRMKMFENDFIVKRFMPGLPIVARIDGRGFSRFTRGMKRPYDPDMSAAMIHTTRELVKHTQATVGYTQSDEITLIWYSNDYKSMNWFDGRVQKMVSLLGSHATLYFNQYIMQYMPQYAKRNPTFDARVWNVPSLEEAANVLVWREWDATKNSIQMAGHHYFSNKELHKKNTSEIQEMLWSQHDVNWHHYPVFFKRGTYIGWKQFRAGRRLTDEEMLLLPPKHHAHKNDGWIEKETRVLTELSLPPITQIENRVEFFFGAKTKGV